MTPGDISPESFQRRSAQAFDAIRGQEVAQLKQQIEGLRKQIKNLKAELATAARHEPVVRAAEMWGMAITRQPAPRTPPLLEFEQRLLAALEGPNNTEDE